MEHFDTKVDIYPIESVQDLRKFVSCDEINCSEPKNAHCPASPHATCAIALLRTKDHTKMSKLRKSYSLQVFPEVYGSFTATRFYNLYMIRAFE